MLEISILSVIGLAAVYWAALWLMGRHEDVLYGDFVTRAAAVPLAPPEPAQRPVALPKPAPIDRLPKPVDSAASRPRPDYPTPQPAHLPADIPSPPAAAPSRDDLLASLLATIKRDLNEAART